MDAPPRSWQRRVLAGIGVTAVLLSCGYLLAYAVARRAVERAWIAEADHTVATGAGLVGRWLVDVTERLQSLAAELPREERAGGPETAAVLEGVRGRDPGTLAAVLLVDGRGRVLASEPRAWPRTPSVVRDPAIHRCAETGSLSVGGPVYGGDGFRYLVVAVPVRAEDGTAGRVVAAVVDLRTVAASLLDAVPMPRSATLFLATGRGRVIALSGDVEGAFPATVDALVPGEGLERLRSLTVSGAGPGAAARVGREDGGGTYFLRGMRLRAVGAGWVVGLLWPGEPPGGGSGHLLLVAGVLFLLPLAAGVGLAAAWRRQGRLADSAEREATHWRQVAEESQRLTRWQVLGEAAREPILFLDGALVESANERAVEALGLSRQEELEGRSLLGFVAEEDRSVARSWLAQDRPSRAEPGTVRVQLVTAAGERRLVEMLVSRLTVEGRDLLRVTWRDLTTRERAEAVLRVVAGAVPLGLALLDDSGAVLWSNEAFSRGMRDLGAEDGDPWPLAVVAAGDRRRARALFARARRGRPGEEVFRTGPGGGMVRVCAAPVFVGGGLFGVVVVARDAAAGGGGAAAGEPRPHEGLGHSLIHRLNNDLQALVGLVQHAGAEADEAHRDIQMSALVEDATRQLRHLAIVCRTEPGTLRRLRLGAAAERWAAAASASLPPRVRVEVRRQTRDDVVLLDAAQLELFLDLAVAGSSSVLLGGGVVEVAVEKAPRPGFVRLAVADTGPAAPAGAAALAAESGAVFRAQDFAREVLRALAARAGGSADAKATTGIGNRLWCDLPLQAGRAESPDVPVARSGRILVADDEALVRSALVEALREAGYETLEAADGAEVLRLVEAEPGGFAMIVLDLVMPVLDGRETLERLKAAWPEIPVLLCTGYEPAGDPVLEGTAALVKPFGIPEFVGRVRSMLSGQADEDDDGGRMAP